MSEPLLDLPEHEPAPRVWERIKSVLQEEGVIKSVSESVSEKVEEIYED